ncbi:hypothetical protein HA402_013106 [Bradysia odoriphaga]|nr:hypothetical protein HA402_013106 [Bradysia odoriphaga]
MNDPTDASYSNDFLSNGFYQLYTTHYDDDILLWNGGDPKLNASDDAVPFRSVGDYGDKCFGYSNYEVMRNEHKIIDDVTDTSNHLWSIPLESNLTKIGGDWELNIENLLFENSVECPEWQLTANDQLPDKTVFCSDSCNLFLKESSESLLSNLNSFDSDKNKNFSLDISHTDQDKIFVCTFNDCKKVYAKSAHLKAHLRRHIGLKPYVCSWPNCTWKFSRSDELSRHRRSHSGIKPYQCLYCTKCFSRSDHLTKHRKVHERKMAAMKVKSNWSNLSHYARQGRKSKMAPPPMVE